eukprot:8037903-Pyramimonas_sp.AAC.1
MKGDDGDTLFLSTFHTATDEPDQGCSTEEAARRAPSPRVFSAVALRTIASCWYTRLPTHSRRTPSDAGGVIFPECSRVMRVA